LKSGEVKEWTIVQQENRMRRFVDQRFGGGKGMIENRTISANISKDSSEKSMILEAVSAEIDLPIKYF
jgi:hypothetical protein